MKILNNLQAYCIILLFIVFFFAPLNSFFSQDDFYHLRQVMDKKIRELPYLFIPSFSAEQTFYRPLSREVYNFTMYSLFNLSPLPYHLVNLLLILLISWLISRFVLISTKQKLIAFFSFIIYLFNSIHSVELYYLSSVQTLLSTTFVLLSLINYLYYLRSTRFRLIVCSLICYILAVLSHESASVALLLLLFLELAINKNISGLEIKKIILRLLPFIVILIARFIIFYSSKGLPDQLVYQPNFSYVSIVNTFSWFTLWSFGLPEMLTDFMTLTLKIDPNLIKFYGNFVSIVFPLFIIFLSLNLLIIFLLRKKIFTSRLFFYFLSAFIISLSPFLFFPQHKFSYYLSLPLVWFSILLGYILNLVWVEYRKLKIAVISLLVIFLVISFQTTSLNKDTHWAAKRAKAAEFILNDIRERYPAVEKGTIFYIKNDPNYPVISKEWGTSSKQAFYILSGSDAFKLLYKDPTINVYYEDIGKPPPLPENTIVYTAKFPY